MLPDPAWVTSTAALVAALAGLVTGCAGVAGAIAGLAWPTVVLAALLLFRREFASMIGKVRKGSVPGLDFELVEDVRSLSASIAVATAELDTSEHQSPAPTNPGADAVPVPGSAVPVNGTQDGGGGDSVAAPDSARVDATGGAENILAVSATSPRAGLMLLSAEVEATLRTVLISSGSNPENIRRKTTSSLTRELALMGRLPPSLARSVDQFWTVRNHVVHGAPWSDAEVLSAIDVGLGLLQLLQTMSTSPLMREIEVIGRVALGLDHARPGSRVARDVALGTGKLADIVVEFSDPTFKDLLVEVKVLAGTPEPSRLTYAVLQLLALLREWSRKSGRPARGALLCVVANPEASQLDTAALRAEIATRVNAVESVAIPLDVVIEFSTKPELASSAKEVATRLLQPTPLRPAAVPDEAR